MVMEMEMAIVVVMVMVVLPVPVCSAIVTFFPVRIMGMAFC